MRNWGMNVEGRLERKGWKAVTSTNPLKKLFVNSIRNHLGFKAKITCVKESENTIKGHVQKYNKTTGAYDSLGVYELLKSDIN